MLQHTRRQLELVEMDCFTVLRLLVMLSLFDFLPLKRLFNIQLT